MNSLGHEPEVSAKKVVSTLFSEANGRDREIIRDLSEKRGNPEDNIRRLNNLYASIYKEYFKQDN